ncbi:hypothetical protein R4Z10_09185 [Niallia sp. XMNu-256]|uniref:tubby C-terminal domain-like protein n=1 Tax=Niallia sp. XMNu-256 TaxID=3082444 RepID=UPI0030CDA9FC
MQKYSYTIPVVKGVKKEFKINDEKGVSKAKIQRYYPNLLNILTEIFLTGWEVNIKAIQDDKEYLIKEHFRWTKNEWSILENDSEIGTLTDIKKIEFGDTKEFSIQGKKYYYLDKPLQTQTSIQDEDNNVIAIIDYKLFDLSRKKEIVVYNNEIVLSLLVCIDYVSTLKKK